MSFKIYCNETLLRTPQNAKQYSAKVDTYFPTAIDAWKQASALNRYDYTPICFKGGKRDGAGFQSASVLAFDFDHIFETSLLDHSPEEVKAKVEEALSLTGSDLAYLAVPSHRLNGMHIFLPLDCEIKESGAYGSIFRYIVSTHHLLDQQVKDTGRFFYATAIAEDIFKTYAVFRRGYPLKAGLLWAQLQAEKRRAEKRRLRQLKSRIRRDGGCFNKCSVDWSRWDFSEGHRNDSLHKAACSILGRHMPNAYKTWKEQADNTGLSEKELATIWGSAVKFIGWEG